MNVMIKIHNNGDGTKAVELCDEYGDMFYSLFELDEVEVLNVSHGPAQTEKESKA